jgi:hypothetical protein
MQTIEEVGASTCGAGDVDRHIAGSSTSVPPQAVVNSIIRAFERIKLSFGPCLLRWGWA